jgi:valyl-tRNA synthetase
MKLKKPRYERRSEILQISCPPSEKKAAEELAKKLNISVSKMLAPFIPQILDTLIKQHDNS